ncbi:MAG: hypothetical protein R3F11_02945 [Verrucomicrobiales bacterium]
MNHSDCAPPGRPDFQHSDDFNGNAGEPESLPRVFTNRRTGRLVVPDGINSDISMFTLEDRFEKLSAEQRAFLKPWLEEDLAQILKEFEGNNSNYFNSIKGIGDEESITIEIDLADQDVIRKIEMSFSERLTSAGGHRFDGRAMTRMREFVGAYVGPINRKRIIRVEATESGGGYLLARFWIMTVLCNTKKTAVFRSQGGIFIQRRTLRGFQNCGIPIYLEWSNCFRLMFCNI